MSFAITRGTGFQITFANGYTVSVQFGPGNYCENRDKRFRESIPTHERIESRDAEVAIIAPSGALIPHPGNNGDTVIGWQSADDVAATIAMVAAYVKVET